MNPAPPTSTAIQPSKLTASAVATPSPLDVLMDQPLRRYDLALEPQNDGSVADIARRCAKMHVAGCASEDDAYLRIIAGRALGLPAMASVQSIFPIKTDTGVVLGMYVKTKLALALSHPEIIEYVRFVEVTAEKAVVVGKRVGQPEAPPSEFTIKDAETAGLVDRGDSRDKQGRSNNNYNKYPKRMLAWRACGALLDQIAGDILHGIASAEDLEDLEPGEPPPARGELPASVAESVPVRDFVKEADALKAELDAAVAARDNAAIRAVRRKFNAFQTDAPAALSEGLLGYYTELATKLSKKSETPKPPPTQYLPPNQRGDAYDGPDQPPVPFGNT